MYPKFKRITIKDGDFISRHTAEFKPYCDFNFANLINWSSPSKPTQYSVLNGNLVIRMKDFTTDKEVVSFIGKNDLKRTVHQLLRDFGELTMVPEECIVKEIQNDPSILIEEDIDNREYILSLDKVSEITGKHLKTKRLHVNRFKRAFPDSVVKELDLSKKETKKEIEDLFSLWATLKNNKKEKESEKKDFENELYGIKQLLKNAKYYGKVVAIGVYIADRLVAFTANQIARPDIVFGNFGKADYRIVGIYSYLEHVTALYLKSLGYSYLNYEQDLGLLGLRFSKEHWAPAGFLKKYKLRFA